jgi:hypothetical protein
MNMLTNKPGRKVTAILLCCLAPTLWAASQTTYKWLDGNGRVTYGDHPPLGVKAQEIRISTGTSSSADAGDEYETQGDQSAATNTTPETKATAPNNNEPSPEEAQRLCEQARGNLEVLQDHALIRQTDADGNVQILDDAQKQEQINTATTIAQRYCK